MKAPVILLLFLLLHTKVVAAELREVPQDFWNSSKEEVRPEGLLTLLTAGATLRVYGHHALELQYVLSRREARYPERRSGAKAWGASESPTT